MIKCVANLLTNKGGPMKKVLIITILSLVFIVVGCGPKPSTQAAVARSSDVPEWYLMPPTAEDAFYGVGDANKPQMSLAKKAATARARDEIAQSVEVKVNTMLKDYMSASGLGGDAEALEFTESVSKHVASSALKGSVVKNTEVGKDGTIYVLVEYSLDYARKEALLKAKSEAEQAKKEEALYNEFKARQGFDALEKELNSMDALPD